MSNRSSLIHVLFLVLSTFVLILLVVNFFRSANNSTNINISSFLNFISNSNIPHIEFSINSFQIAGEWVILDGLRQFINILGSVFGSAVYMAVSVVNIIIYCVYFLAFIFA